ncbi:carbohydrate ABC transporter permease [Gracilibacillus alcaliphilus]|uniref:carbohydrate ABC transporter permease n=1 Tax=Gracilibacillus alcaliphilus TaxID=1401441 RepID=UPI001958A8A4|nr:carbohydrate ABC transporter permease [Gracilibacillus alcaliphilus]MBM7677670.1 ABC-type glycerol-3-phosphate transport system permease component [Gracilibacillus alcaliphilus]
MSAKQKRILTFIFRWSLTLGVAMIILIPLYWVFISSITPRGELFSTPINFFPENFTFQNYVDLFVELDVATMAWNTLIITVCSLLLTIILGTAAAYAFARFELFQSVSWAFRLLLFSALIPPVITARPLYDFMKSFDLVDTYAGLIILYTSLLLPFSVLILYNFVKQIPASLEEAAQIDGANFGTILFKIYFPLMKPAIATVSIINFIQSLNEFFTPLFFTYKIKLLSVGITTVPRESNFEVPWDLISAMGWFIILPIILFVLFFEKNIMEGITQGGVKQ